MYIIPIIIHTQDHRAGGQNILQDAGVFTQRLWPCRVIGELARVRHCSKRGRCHNVRVAAVRQTQKYDCCRMEGKIGAVWLVSLDLASAYPLPEPPQLPYSANSNSLLPSPNPFRFLSYPSLPHGADPPPQPILDPFPLYGPLLGHNSGCHFPRSIPAWNALGQKDTPLNEHFGRGPDGETPCQTDGNEGARQFTRHDGRVGQEDGAGDEVCERRARRRVQKRRQYGTCTAEAKSMKDGRQGQGAQLTRRLSSIVSLETLCRRRAVTRDNTQESENKASRKEKEV